MASGRGKKPNSKSERVLWARSGGRCQHPGCATDLLSLNGLKIYWERINTGEMAHNVASNPRGPRGDEERSHDLSDDPDNILVLCGKCHTIADSLPDVYREEILQSWKQRHEARVTTAARMTEGDIVVPIIVAATQIGGHSIHINDVSVFEAILADNRIPVSDPYRIILDTRGQPDASPSYWASQINLMRDHLRLLASGANLGYQDAPKAIFPLAEMPLLIAFGNALGDKSAVEIYQHVRHAGSWTYQNPESPAPLFTTSLPTSIDERGVALIVDLSARIAEERVVAAVPNPEMPIARFSTPSPSTELVQSRRAVQAFQRDFRQCLTDLENRSSRSAPIHLFPCLPAPLAVALGRTIMPKVSNPITVYDAKGADGPFLPCVTLPLPLTTDNNLHEGQLP